MTTLGTEATTKTSSQERGTAGFWSVLFMGMLIDSVIFILLDFMIYHGKFSKL